MSDYAQHESLGDLASHLKLKPAPTLGKNAMRTETIKRVNGSVRLSANIELRDANCLVELMVSDRDIGRGYRLRLIGGKDNDRLELMREKRVLTSRDLGQLARGQIMRLTIERKDDVIIGSIGQREPLRFPDLVPIEGEKASGTYIAFVPGEVRVSDVQLDRQRSTLFISALELADNERQSNDFANAKDMYEQFLRDHPQSPQARDAQLRIGLCLEAMDNPLAYEQALNTFIEVASANRDDPRYVLTATVHAWSCALRLGRYQEAEEFYDAVRRDNDLTTVLATVSEAMVQELVKDYLTRARTIAAAEPERALKLFSNGAEIAAYLKQIDAAAEAETDAGDILMSLERSNQALERYRVVSNNMQLPLPLRFKALLKVGEAERMRDHLEAAEIALPGHPLQPGAGRGLPVARPAMAGRHLCPARRHRRRARMLGQVQGRKVPAGGDHAPPDLRRYADADRRRPLPGQRHRVLQCPPRPAARPSRAVPRAPAACRRHGPGQ